MDRRGGTAELDLLIGGLDLMLQGEDFFLVFIVG
jgi:hypothetical protein